MNKPGKIELIIWAIIGLSPLVGLLYFAFLLVVGLVLQWTGDA